MKNKVLSSLFYDTTLFDFQSFAIHEGEFSSSKEIFAYGLVLTYHPKIRENVNKVRKKLNISLLTYPKTRNMEALVDFLHELPESLSPKLQEEVNTLIKQYKLISVWELPLKIKILTNVLPFPYEPSRLQFSYPVKLLDEYPNSLRLAMDILDAGRRAAQPCIVITEYVKPDNIFKYIKHNWKTIEPVLASLPKRHFRGVDINTFALGVWIFIRRELEKQSWDEIDKAIDEITNQDEEFWGGKDSTPTRLECQKRLDEIKNDFNKIYPL